MYKRYRIQDTLNEEEAFIDDDDIDDDDIERWLTKSERRIVKANTATLGCEGMVLEIDDDVSDDPNICEKLSGRMCGGYMKRVDVPLTSEIDLYSTNGVKLMPGKSYCAYKEPPTNENSNCDPVWGFWHFSQLLDRWVCKSKVPGVYNANLDEFNPCGPLGSLTIDGRELKSEDIPVLFTPRDFYATEMQGRFECKCSPGYVSRPDLSRTTCFPDPCLASLPPYADAPGYRHSDDSCDCGEHFVNIDHDPQQPCTACPYNFPSWDAESNVVSVYVKCYAEEEIPKSGGGIPCLTEEDRLRGCAKVNITVKPVPRDAQPLKFEDRIFFKRILS